MCRTSHTCTVILKKVTFFSITVVHPHFAIMIFLLLFKFLLTYDFMYAQFLVNGLYTAIRVCKLHHHHHG